MANGPSLSLAPQLLEDDLVFFRFDPLLTHASTHRHEERIPTTWRSVRRQQFRHRLDLLEIATRDRRVDLHGQLQLPRVLQHLPRPLETAFPASKRVVGLRVGTIQADPQRLDSSLLDRLKRFARGQRRRRRSQGNVEARATPRAQSATTGPARFRGSPPVSTRCGFLGNLAT